MSELTKPTLYIEAIFIRSASIISHYPATALLGSFGEIVRHHANLNEVSIPQHASEQVQGKAENTNQEAKSRDSPVPTQTYLVPNIETDLGLPDPSHAHLLPESETSEVGTDLVIVRGNGHKGPDDDKPSTVSSTELMQKSEAIKGYEYQTTEHQSPVPCLGPALPTQPDSPTQPEIHSIATSSEDDIAPETTKANDSHNPSGTGEQGHSHPSRIKPRITGKSQVLRAKKGHERQHNPKPILRKREGKPCIRRGKAMRVSSEENIQVVLGADRYVILSLFDGCGISRAIVAECLKQQPVAALSAESDSVLRSIICHKYDYDKSQRWAFPLNCYR